MNKTEIRQSWVPMIGLFLAQVLMSFNVAALPISLGGMVEDFGVPPTVASSTIVVYGLAVAALVMTGAKVGARIGWVMIFRIVVLLFAISSLMMIFSPTVQWAIGGQVLAGACAAIIVPALVALIAENYRGGSAGHRGWFAGFGTCFFRDERVFARWSAGYLGWLAPNISRYPGTCRPRLYFQFQTAIRSWQ